MRSAKRDVAILQAAFPECAITRGWHLDGAGPARFGYAALHPSGKVRYLDRTAYDSVQGLLREIDARNNVAPDDDETRLRESAGTYRGGSR